MAGCDVDASPETGVATSELTGESEQGVYMIGPVADGLAPPSSTRYLRVSQDPRNGIVKYSGYTVDVTPAAQGANLVATSPTRLTHTGNDAWFEGMILEDVDGNYQLRIDPSASTEGLSTAYHVMSNKRLAGGAWEGWREYCGTSDVRAVPLRGAYDRTRIHRNEPSITFGCLNAISGKCPLWGYVAGTDGPAPALQDTPWNLNQACTLMGNARYCPRGGSHTREGTPIQYGNFSGVPYGVPSYPLPSPIPGDPDAYSFEAGWSITGPVCLSKLRWRSLPAAPCNADLPDPRTVEGRAAGGVFCDELDYTTIRNRGGLIIQGSKVMDAPMQPWRSPWSPVDQVLSMRGYVANEDPALVEIVSPRFLPVAPPPPAPPAPANSYATSAATASDHMILRNLPSSLPEASMVKLYRWYEPTTRDRVVLDVAPPAPAGKTYGSEDFEGWAFKTRLAPTMPELRRCGGFGNYTTTIGACPSGAGVPLGYYVLPPP